MPVIYWEFLIALAVVLNGIAIIIRKERHGISFFEQFKKEKWIILIFLIVVAILIPLSILF